MCRRETEAVPDAHVFETELEWLVGPETEEEVANSRVVLTDRETVLVGSFYSEADDVNYEQAIFATGL